MSRISIIGLAYLIACQTPEKDIENDDTGNEVIENANTENTDTENDDTESDDTGNDDTGNEDTGNDDIIYTDEEIEYFFEVAMNVEFGGNGQSQIHKWEEDLFIQVHGNPTSSDLQNLDAIIEELNALQSSVQLLVVEQNANVDIYFSSANDFREIEPNYIAGNDGFFWTYWDQGTIVLANIFVLDNQAEVYRNHLLREELTQCLGLMNDSYLYEDSIFYAGWTDTTEYMEIDRTLVSMLYREDIEVNMDGDEVFDILVPRISLHIDANGI